MRRRGPAFCLAVAALAGCAAPAPGAPPLNLSGFPPAFRQGYADGCAAAGSRAPSRDEARYTAEPDYAQGWNDGHAICAKRRVRKPSP